MKNYISKLSFVFVTFLLIFISLEGNAMEDNAFSFKFAIEKAFSEVKTNMLDEIATRMAEINRESD